jgi:hypothetical protein
MFYATSLKASRFLRFSCSLDCLKALDRLLLALFKRELGLVSRAAINFSPSLLSCFGLARRNYSLLREFESIGSGEKRERAELSGVVSLAWLHNASRGNSLSH